MPQQPWMRALCVKEGKGNLRFTSNRRIAWHGLGRHVVIAVRTVQEGLAPLALWKAGVQYQTWAGLGIQRAASRWWAILHLKAARRKGNGQRREKQEEKRRPFATCRDRPHYGRPKEFFSIMRRREYPVWTVLCSASSLFTYYILLGCLFVLWNCLYTEVFQATLLPAFCYLIKAYKIHLIGLYYSYIITTIFIL